MFHVAPDFVLQHFLDSRCILGTNSLNRMCSTAALCQVAVYSHNQAKVAYTLLQYPCWLKSFRLCRHVSFVSGND